MMLSEEYFDLRIKSFETINQHSFLIIRLIRKVREGRLPPFPLWNQFANNFLVFVLIFKIFPPLEKLKYKAKSKM